jgi:flagellar hook-associated protein 3 FlgL
MANLSRAKTETDTAEKSLGHAITLLDRAIVLASQGASTIVTPESRRIIAGEVQGLLEQLVADSQTVAEGRYVFSGDRDQEPAYQLNLASPTGADRLFQTQASRRIEHPSGQNFQASKTAQEIFDTRNPDDTPASDNVFAAVNGLRLALETDDQAGIEASMTALRRASERLNIEQSFYGAVQNKIEAAIEFGSKNNVLLESELSARQDADLTAAALELDRATTHQEAALAARARLPRTSLLDYLD